MCKIKGEERHTGTMCQEMQELPGKDSGKGNPGEAVLVTLRLAGVWSGDQQPWGEREEAEVQCRAPGEKADRHPCLRYQRAAPIPGHRSTYDLGGLSLGLTPRNSGSVGHGCVFSSIGHSSCCETAGNGTVFMPKEMEGILIPVLRTQCPRAPFSVLPGAQDHGRPS